MKSCKQCGRRCVRQDLCYVCRDEHKRIYRFDHPTFHLCERCGCIAIVKNMCWMCRDVIGDTRRRNLRRYRLHKLLTMRVSGLSVEDIAAIEKIPPSSVKYSLRRAQIDVFRISVDGKIQFGGFK